MSLQQRQPPASDDDLEVTAELPVLDVMAYEANVASAAAAVASHEAAQEVAPEITHEFNLGANPDLDHINDTIHMPLPPLRPNRPAADSGAGRDEGRARLEVNLQSLARTLREVEERLTRKSERLTEIERALDVALGERNAAEQHARVLSDDADQARAHATAAQVRIGELEQILQEHHTAAEAQRTHDADSNAQLSARNARLEEEIAAARQQSQEQIVALTRDAESRIEVLTRDAQARIDSLEKDRDVQLTTTRSESQTTLDEVRRDSRQRIETLTQETDARIAAANQEAQARIEALTHDSQSRVDTAVRDAMARIDSNNREVQQRLETVQRDAQARIETTERTTQEELASLRKQHGIQLAGQARALAAAERELEDVRARAAEYLETLQSNEGRRSVFEDLVSRLDGDVAQREQTLAQLQSTSATQAARVGDLETELRERVSRIAALESQVSALTAALAQKTEQVRELEQQRETVQQNLHAQHGSLSERNDRIKVLEGTVDQQQIIAAQLRGELERAASERNQLLTAAASYEASVRAASVRGDQQEAAARASQTRIDELELLIPIQRRRVEQLETEVAAVRAELQSSSSALERVSSERSGHVAHVTAADERIAELEGRLDEQQQIVRQLQAAANEAAAQSTEIEDELLTAQKTIRQMQAEASERDARLQELEATNQEWRATVEEARGAIADRDKLIQRLEQETANSAVLVGHIQRSITRMDHGTEHTHEPAPDGNTRLLIRTDGDTEVVHVLGRKTSVGRTPDNDLQIDAKFISRHHAVILSGPTHAIIEDLNSTNGVLVNNRRITRQPLKDGDNVMIGKTQFRFVVRAAKG